MKYTAELEKAIDQQEQTAALCIELQILHLYEECIGFDIIESWNVKFCKWVLERRRTRLNGFFFSFSDEGNLDDRKLT